MDAFQILGACARRGYVDDWVTEGSLLDVENDGDSIWALRDGRRIGIFPPTERGNYAKLPEAERYKHVVVVRDVNLNDKYGQCFVRPLFNNSECKMS